MLHIFTMCQLYLLLEQVCGHYSSHNKYGTHFLLKGDLMSLTLGASLSVLYFHSSHNFINLRHKCAAAELRGAKLESYSSNVAVDAL